MIAPPADVSSLSTEVFILGLWITTFFARFAKGVVFHVVYDERMPIVIFVLCPNAFVAVAIIWMCKFHQVLNGDCLAELLTAPLVFEASIGRVHPVPCALLP